MFRPRKALFLTVATLSLMGAAHLVLSARVPPQGMRFSTSLSVGQETPTPTGSPTGTGQATLVLNAAENQITVSLAYSGVSGTVTAAHIHGSATSVPGQTAAILFDLAPTGGSTGVNTNSVFAITPTQVAWLKSARLYVNVHTSANPGGQIRGQLHLHHAFGDADADGRTDFAVLRPTNAHWYLLQSATSTMRHTQWGLDTDIPVPGDYDGDGSLDSAVFRPTDRTWYVFNSGDSTWSTLVWGLSDDVPVPGDFDGDGRTDFAVFRPSTGDWYIHEADGGIQSVHWGAAGDRPVVADFDGDGRADVSVARIGAAWYVLGSASGTASIYALDAGQLPLVPADYNGDGRADPAVFDPETTVWTILDAVTGAPTLQNWGSPFQTPVPGDYDSDGKTDLATYEPSSGIWFVRTSADGGLVMRRWGAPNDVPVPSMYTDPSAAPSAVNDSVSVLEDAPATAVDVLANDPDADGGVKKIFSTTQPANGTVVITGEGTGLTYQPNGNYCNTPPGSALDTFTYTLAPGGSTATVTVTVDCDDDAPVAVNDTVTVPRDSVAYPIGVLLNDTDVDGGTKLVIAVTQPANGTVAIVSGGAGVRYTPTAAYCNSTGPGPDTFDYTITGGSSATVSVTVPCGPTANPDAATVLEDSGATAVPVLANDSNPVPDTLSISAVTQPANGVVAITGGGTGLTYAPGLNYCNTPSGAADTFTYTLMPGGTVATVSMTVTCVNDAPAFVVGAGPTVLEDAGGQSVDPWATAISPGPGPSEAGQAVAFVITNNTNAGLFAAGPVVSPTGALTFTPAANAFGTATITLKITDDGGTANSGVNESVTQQFVITVTAVNDAPSFVKGGDPTVLEGAGAQAVNPWATSLSAGPGEGAQTLAFVITGNTNAGLFSAGPSVSSAGILTFTPATDAFGTATITLKITDDGGTANSGVNESATQQFVITVTGVNDAPSFTKGADQTVLEDAGAQTVDPWATAVSAGPGEGTQTVTFVITNNTNAGLFAAAPAVSPAGVLTYTPALNAFGTATITLKITDDGGIANSGVNESVTQQFVITVTPVNDAPSFVKGGDPTVLEGAGAQAVNPWATSLSAGPANESAQTLAFVITDNSNASLFSAGPSVSSAGILTFTPAADAFGTATITLKITDDGGTANSGVNESATQQFVITVTGINDAPSFTKGADDTVLEDSGPRTVDPWATAVSAGPGEGSQVLTFVITNNTNAALFAAGPAVSPTGVLTYTPATNAFGTATITLKITDDGGTTNSGVNESATQQFVITVTGVNDAPSFTVGPNESVNENTGAHVVSPWATGVSAGPGEGAQTVQFVITNNTNPGLFAAGPAVSNTGALSYTLNPSVFGVATITLKITDDGGTANSGVNESATQQFTITVVDIPDAPIAGADGYDFIGNTTLQVGSTQSVTPSVFVNSASGVFVNDSDSDSSFTLTGLGACPNGSAPLTCASANGGSVTMQGDGTFFYTPKEGDVLSTDVFTYRITDGTSITTGTVTLTRTRRVWYVNNTATAGGLGRSSDPFDTLVEAQTASAATDYIFVYYGNGTSSGMNAGITLKANQHLIGQYSGLTIPVALNPLGAGSTVLVAVPGATCGGTNDQPCRPKIDGVADAVNATVAVPLEIRGFSLLGGTGNAIDFTIADPSTGASSLTIADNYIRGAGAEGIDVNVNTVSGGTPGTLSIAVRNNAWGSVATHVGSAIDISRQLGASAALVLDISDNTGLRSAGGLGIFVDGGLALSTTITNLANNTVTGDVAGGGIVIVNTTFDAVPGGGYTTVPGGVTTIGTLADPTGQAGMNLLSVAGDVTFTSLDSYSGSGPALGAFGGSNLRLAMTGTGVLRATNGPALTLNGVTADLEFTSLTSLNASGSSGVLLNFVDGNVTVTGATTVTDTSGMGIDIGSLAAGGAVNFGNTTVNGSSDTGVNLNANEGTVTFADLDIAPDAGQIALNAAGASTGLLTVSSGTFNTTGAGVNVSNSPMALSLDSVTAGADNGHGVYLENVTGSVVINNGALTGNAGVPTFRVLGGTGTVTYNGTITQNFANHAVLVRDKTAGTATFGGLITASTSTATAVNVFDNTGATVLFTGGLDLTTTVGTGFNSGTGGGTVGVTGANNTISCGACVGLSLGSFTVHTSGITFKSVSTNASPVALSIANLDGGGTAGVKVTGVGTTAGSGGTIVNTAGSAALLTNLASLGGGVTLNNLNILGGGGITGSNFGTLKVANTSLSAATNTGALNLTTGTFGTASTFSTLSSSTVVASSVLLSGVTGDFSASAGTITNATGATWSVVGGTVTSTYSGNLTQANNAAMVSVSGGHTTGTITFDTGTLNAIAITSGSGLQFDNADGTYNFSGTTNLTAGDAGIDILNGSSGTFTFGANTVIANSGSAANAFELSNSNATVTYNGSITDNLGRVVNIDNHDGGTITFNNGPIQGGTGSTGLRIANSNSGTVNFNASSIQLSTGANVGVDLSANNGGGTMNFATGAGAGLDIVTTSGAGLLFTGGGTLSITGSGNSIQTATGQIIVAGPGTSVIGGSGIAFGSLQSTGTVPNIAIDLNDLDGAGTFNGGNVTIAATSGGGASDGIFIHGGSSATFSFDSATIGATGGRGIALVGGNGPVTFTTVAINGGASQGVEVNGATAAVTISGGNIGNTNDPDGNSVYIKDGTGTVTIGAHVNKTLNNNVIFIDNHETGTVTFSGNVTSTYGGIAILNVGSGAISFTGQNITINTGVNGAIALATNSGGTVNFTPTAGGTGLDLTTTTATAFSASGGGTITVTGSGNSISTTTGPILNWNGVSVGGAGVKFDTMAASGTVAGADGILLTNVDGTGNIFDGGAVTVAGTTGVSSDGIDIQGGSLATFTFASAAIDGTSNNGISIDGVNGPVTVGTVDIDGVGSAGINVSGGNTSTVNINGGSIGGTNDPAGSAVSIASGTGNISIAASVTKTTAGNIVAIASRTGGTITISGNLSATGSANNGLSFSNNSGGSTTLSGTTKTINTAGNTALSVTNNANHTVTFSGSTTDMDTTTANAIDVSNGGTLAFTSSTSSTVNATSGKGFQADGGGTVVVTGNAQIAASSGTAIDIQNTTIGAGNVTFQSASAGSGAGSAGNGITLDTTGSSGGLIVTGTGSAGSGGTIQHKTGADQSRTSGIGIYLNSTKNVALSRMQLNDFDNFAIRGNNVSGFSIANSVVNGTNGTNVNNITGDSHGEGSIYFGNNGGVSADTDGGSGTFSITNTTISGGRSRNVSIVDSGTSGGAIHLTITGDTFGLTQAVAGNQSLAVEARGSGTTTHATVQSSTFAGAAGDNMNFTGQQSTTMHVIVGGAGVGNTLTNTHPNNNVGSGSMNFSTAGIMYFDARNNTMSGANGSAVTFFKAASNDGSTPQQHGTFDGNTIGTGVAGSGSSGSGNGIFISAGGTGLMRYAITNNIIQAVTGNASIYADNTGGTYDVDLTITGNTVHNTSNGVFAGLALTAGGPSTLSDDVDVFAKITDNDFSDSGPSSTDIFMYAATAASTMTLANSVAGNVDTEPHRVAFLQAANNLNGHGGITSISAGLDGTATNANWVASAGAPPLPTAPTPLLLVPGGVDAADGPSAVLALSQGALESAVTEALRRWTMAGLSSEQVDRLGKLKFEVADLPVDYLGESRDGRIRVDRDAAAKGWFVEPGSASDARFATKISETRRTTDPSGIPAGRLDLLTAILHEMGHALGLSDKYDPSDCDDIMYGYLTKGERRLPARGQAPTARRR